MEQRRLGRTGLSVSKLCLGAMMFGDWGTRDHDESIRIIHRAVDAGINFIDTADVYSEGESEVIVGKALASGKRDDVVLETKVHMPMAGIPTTAATRGAGSCARSRSRWGGWAPTGSTSTRSTLRSRRRHRALRGRAEPHRRDRAPRHDRQPRRRRLGQSRPRAGGPAPVGRRRIPTRRRSRWRSRPRHPPPKDRPRHSPATSGSTPSPTARNPPASASTWSASPPGPAAPGTPRLSARPSMSPMAPGWLRPGAATSSGSEPETDWRAHVTDAEYHGPAR